VPTRTFRSLLLTAGILTAGVASADLNCSQPVSDGASPVIGDCLRIARASIGSAAACPLCACDTNGSGEIEISDALRCLFVVIGRDVDLECPVCSETTTTTVPTCATCSEAFYGEATRADLCEFDRQLYDSVKQCLCSCCDLFCCGSSINLCTVWIPEDPPTCKIGEATACLIGGCREDIQACTSR
jgi:hypothetical protein